MELREARWSNNAWFTSKVEKAQVEMGTLISDRVTNHLFTRTVPEVSSMVMTVGQTHRLWR